MFELPAGDTCTTNNSYLGIRNEKSGMNTTNNSIISCPSVLAGMSHEMRTHMNAIVAFSFLMKENCSNDTEREEFSNQVLNSCEQLIGLFDSFLDTAIIDSGNSKADSRRYLFDNLLDDLFSEFRVIINKEGHKNLELVTEIRFSNSTEVFIDKNKIFRVITSLFHNSVKNTKSGYIKVGYQLDDNKVTFYVLDSGQGYFKCKEFLHTEDLNKSLSLYNDTQTAINLTLAKKLIQLLGGNIWIECNGLTGTGIYFSVPAQMVLNPEVNINNYNNTMIAI
jgi:signal transduction histidine kinase